MEVYARSALRGALSRYIPTNSGIAVLMNRPSLSVVSCGPVDTAVNSTACIAATAAVLHRADACRLLVKFHPRAPTGMRTLHMMYVPQDFAQTAEKCAQSLCWTLKIASQRCSERSRSGLRSRCSPSGPCAPFAARSAGSHEAK